jgi:hypothetical protein
MYRRTAEYGCAGGFLENICKKSEKILAILKRCAKL